MRDLALQARRQAEEHVGPGVSISTLTVTRWVTKSDLFVLLMVPHHGGSGRATVSSRTRKEAQHVLVEVRA
jgi:hypothetical protein